MTPPRRRGLQIDDPLGPTQPTQPAARPTTTDAPTASTNRRVDATDRLSKEGPRGEDPETPRQDETVAAQYMASRIAQPTDREAWRAWSGITGVGSFRLPHELLAELGDAARGLRLPVGMIVAAAITQLLDQPPEEIAVLVDKADDARIQGRRRARRRVITQRDV